MAAIVRRVALDLRSLRPYAKQAVFVLVVVFLPVVVSPGNDPSGMIPLAVVLSAAIVPQYLFGNDERGRLDTLYVVLGINRRDTVAGRYATSFLVMIALAAISALLALAIAAGLGAPLDVRTAAPLTAGCIALGGVVLAVQLPVYFAVGFARARPVTFAALAITVLAFLAPTLVFPELGRAVLDWIAHADPLALSLAALVLPVVAVAISAPLSARLYARRDL